MKKPTLTAQVQALASQVNTLVKQAVRTHENVVFLSDQVDALKQRKQKTAPRKLGWMPEIKDRRAYAFVPRADAVRNLPESVDLRPLMPPVWNQGSIGSCVAHAVAAAHIVAQKKNRTKTVMPSRLALYFAARAMRGWQGSDTGAYICDAFKAAAKLGVADEKLYPYTQSRVLLKPPASVYANALLNQAVEYRKVDNTNVKALKAALADGNPVVFGTVLHEGYDKLVDDVMPDPDLNARPEGGHAMLLCGYDNARKLFLVRNSWGAGWGMGGYHWASESYLTNPHLTDDCWVLVSTEK